MLCLAGVPFEDYRFANREEFLALKPSLKFGQVPCLQVDGREVFQSAAIMRFIAKNFGSTSLYPADPALAAEVDALLDQIKDMDIGKGVASYKQRFGFARECESNPRPAHHSRLHATSVGGRLVRGARSNLNLAA